MMLTPVLRGNDRLRIAALFVGFHPDSLRQDFL